MEEPFFVAARDVTAALTHNSPEDHSIFDNSGPFHVMPTGPTSSVVPASVRSRGKFEEPNEQRRLLKTIGLWGSMHACLVRGRRRRC